MVYLILVALLALLAYFAFMGRAVRRREEASRLDRTAPRDRPRPTSRPQAEELMRCAVCGAYVPATATACTRDDCRFPARP